MRPRHDFGEELECVRRHSELGQRNASALFVEKSQDDALPAERWDRRNANVDLSILQSQTNASVLRDASLGDVEVGHDLDAANDRRRKVRRRRRCFLKNSIDAVPHTEAVLITLEVDVRRPCIERLDEQQIDQSNDRRLVRQMQQIVEWNLVAAYNTSLASQSGDHALRRHGLLRVDPANRGPKVMLAETLELHVGAEQQTQVVDR